MQSNFRLKQSVCLPMMMPKGTPLGPFLKELARIGYVAVEIWERDESLEELAARAHENKLVISQMTGHNSIASGLNDPAQHARI